MNPQFETIAVQERVDPRNPPDGVIAAHVLDNMQTLIHGTESQLTQPAQDFQKIDPIIPSKFEMTDLKTNKSPIPDNHDCDKCIIDATACTLLQAANENSSFMDRLKAVAQLKKTVPDFDSIPNEEMDALIKQEINTIKSKRVAMESVPVQKPEIFFEQNNQAQIPTIEPQLIRSIEQKKPVIHSLPQLPVRETTMDIQKPDPVPHLEKITFIPLHITPPITETNIPEVNEKVYFHPIEKKTVLKESKPSKVISTDIQPSENPDKQGKKKSETVIPVTENQNVFTYKTEPPNIFPKQNEQKIRYQIIEETVEYSEIQETTDEEGTADSDGLLSESMIETQNENLAFPINTTEPAAIDYLFDDSDNFVPVNESPVIQPDLLTPEIIKIATETNIFQEPINILEEIQTNLKPLIDISEGTETIVDVGPVLQMIYIHQVPEDEPISQSEPEIIIEPITVQTEPETPVNNGTPNQTIPERYTPEKAVVVMEKIKETIDIMSHTDTVDSQQRTWTHLVESQPILNDLSDLLSTILLKLIIINNAETFGEIYSEKNVANSSLLYRYLSQKASKEESLNSNNNKNPVFINYFKIITLLWLYSIILTTLVKDADNLFI
jgi:hypothetical protein